VRVTNGHELDNGYVEIAHGTQYQIVMRNDRATACDARVTIDGKEIGSFRIWPNSSITLERKPGSDAGRFTFFREGTEEAKQSQVETGSPNNGLISVVFTPERARPIQTVTWGEPYWYPWWTVNPYEPKVMFNSWVEPRVMSFSADVGGRGSRAGGTGLTGHSNQNFSSVGALDYDYSGQTQINLRLICSEQSQIRPLSGQSNPIPPYIH
jgi:hypothetical protein